MTVAEVRLFQGPVYTVSSSGWTGPDPDVVEVLNFDCPPHYTRTSDPVLRAAHLAVRLLDGELVSTRDDSDGEPDAEDEDPPARPDAETA